MHKLIPSHTVCLFIGHGGPELSRSTGLVLDYIPDNSVNCTKIAITKKSLCYSYMWKLSHDIQGF